MRPVRPILRLVVFAVASIVLAAALAFAQEQPVAAGGQAGVPPLVRFAGTLPRASAGPVEVTFALYERQTGGEPLWSETQTVVVAATGRYAVLLGATHAEGLPLDLFANGEARWLGIRVADAAELPRAALFSVPYALKAADADTVGGKPVSAFVLAGQSSGGSVAAAPDSSPAGAGTPLVTSGSVGYLGKFTSSVDLGNSALFQAGTNIGLGTTNPAAAFHVVGTAAPAALVDVYGALTALPLVNRAARGTPSAPAALQADDILGGLAVRGFGATTFSTGVGQVMYRAAENWTDTAHGTYLTMTTTPAGSSAWVERLRIDPAGNVGIGTPTPGQRLSVAGMVESTAGFKFPDGTVQVTASAGGGAYAAGSGLSLAGNVFSANFAGSGTAPTIAHSDHQHQPGNHAFTIIPPNHGWVPLTYSTCSPVHQVTVDAPGAGQVVVRAYVSFDIDHTVMDEDDYIQLALTNTSTAVCNTGGFAGTGVETGAGFTGRNHFEVAGESVFSVPAAGSYTFYLNAKGAPTYSYILGSRMSATFQPQ